MDAAGTQVEAGLVGVELGATPESPLETEQNAPRAIGRA
jgi:hypothetical protein